MMEKYISRTEIGYDHISMVNWSLTKVLWSFSGEKEVFQEMLWNNGINMLEGEFLCLWTLKLLFGIWTMVWEALGNTEQWCWIHYCLPMILFLCYFLALRGNKSYQKRNKENQWPSAICHRTNITVYVCSKKKKKSTFFNVYLERDQSY